MKKGLFIAIEGTDGSGKTTQFKLLVKALKRAGYKIATADFPQHNKPAAYFVDKYLNGSYGTAQTVGPYRGSFFYALDRYDASFQIKKWLAEDKIVVTNRYVLSNAGHQGGKIKKSSEQKRYWRWLFDLEYRLFGIPKPDINVLLHMPARVAQKLVDKKKARAYVGGKKRDLHEADLEHLQQAERAYRDLAKIYDISIVECVKNKILTPKEIHYKVWRVVSKLLK